jgi:hypothetical protein
MLSAFVSLALQRFLGLLQCFDREIIPGCKRKPAGSLLAIAEIYPELTVELAVALIEPFDAAIAGIAHGRKLRDMCKGDWGVARLLRNSSTDNNLAALVYS